MSSPRGAAQSTAHSRTKPGRKTMQQDGSGVLKAGWLMKKGGGLKGFRAWSKFWGIVDSKGLLLFKNQQSTEPTTTIGIADIMDAVYLPKKRVGARFDVLSHINKLWSFDAESDKDAPEWVEAIAHAHELYINQAKHHDQDRTILDEIPNKTFSAFQKVFFEAKFGTEAMTTPPSPQLTFEEKMVIKQITTRYSLDKDVLYHLLDEYIGTKFEIDMSLDDEPPQPDVIQHNIDKANQPGELGRMIAMLLGPNFVRTLGLLTGLGQEGEASGLAVRMLWAIYRGIFPRDRARIEFAKQIQIFAGGPHFTSTIQEALLLIILHPPKDIVSKREVSAQVSFYTPVQMPSAWIALLGAMKDSPLLTRSAMLKDLNTLLHDNLDNCKSIVKFDEWQYMLLPLFTDLVRSQKGEEPTKTAYVLAVNVVTLVLFEFFVKTDQFGAVAFDTLLKIYNYGGCNNESGELAATLFGALLNKITVQKKTITINAHDITWKNLFVLTNLMRRFVFQCTYWQTWPLGYGVELPGGGGGVPLLPQSESRQGWDEEEYLDYDSDGGGRAHSNSQDRGHGYLFFHRRLGKHDIHFDKPETEITDFGLHWENDEEGVACDTELVNKIILLLKTLGLVNFNADLFQNPDDRECMRLGNKEYEFWDQTTALLTMVRRADIDRRKSLTFKRFGYLCRAWLQKSKADRQSLMKNFQKLLAGEKMMVLDIGEDNVEENSSTNSSSTHSNHSSTNHSGGGGGAIGSGGGAGGGASALYSSGAQSERARSGGSYSDNALVSINNPSPTSRGLVRPSSPSNSHNNAANNPLSSHAGPGPSSHSHVSYPSSGGVSAGVSGGVSASSSSSSSGANSSGGQGSSHQSPRNGSPSIGVKLLSPRPTQ